MTPDHGQKPDITYPCPWGFKVIGLREEALREAVGTCLAGCLGTGEARPHTLDFSRTSAQGKYVSLVLGLEVRSEQERDALFGALAAHPDIRLVI